MDYLKNSSSETIFPFLILSSNISKRNSMLKLTVKIRELKFGRKLYFDRIFEYLKERGRFGGPKFDRFEFSQAF